MQKKICAVYGKDAVTDQTCRTWSESFVLEIACWTMPQGRVDQLKLIVIKSKRGEQSTLYHAGHSWLTQNSQINKLIGGREKSVFYFMEKTK